MLETRKRRRNLAIAGIACIFLLLTAGAFLRMRAEQAPVQPSVSLASSEHGSLDAEGKAPASTASSDAQGVGLSDDDPSEATGAHPEFELYGLTSGKCGASFSQLYAEIDRAVALRKSNGLVTPSDIDLQWKKDGAVRAMIYRQKLYILESKIVDVYYPERALSILHQIDRAVTASPEPLPNVEFSFVITDIPDPSHSNHTIWSLSRLPVDENMWLMPDFGYWSWPLDLVGSYEQIRRNMYVNEPDWEDKIPKALWRGAVKQNEVRPKLIEATRGKDWADVEGVRWKSKSALTGDSAANAVSIEDHCEYQFLIHTEGQSYSGRGKYLLNCASVVIMHKSEWIEPHQSVLVRSGPDQNFVEVERDFSDLEKKMQELLHDPDRAKAIASNSVNTFRDRFLSPAAQACYWRHLIRSWADVSFQPKPWKLVDGKKTLRGVPFETFVVQAAQTPPACPRWKKLLLQC